MSNILENLEKKITSAIETIELLRLQLEESENQCKVLHKQNNELQSKQNNFEQNINQLLAKLDNIESEDTHKHKVSELVG